MDVTWLGNNAFQISDDLINIIQISNYRCELFILSDYLPESATDFHYFKRTTWFSLAFL